MNLQTNRVWSGIALLAALSLTPSHVQAQQGNFYLPVEAHWGNVVLPAGSYRISVPMRATWPEIMEISGQGKTFAILPELEVSRRASGHSHFSLLQINGTYVIREFESGASGKVFTFPVPKTMQTKVADLRQEQTQFPVVTSGQ